MPSSHLTLGLVQSSCTLDPATNWQKTEQAVITAAHAGAQVICLQELFRSVYFCQSEDHAYFQLAESIPGPTSQALGQLAGKLRVVIIASLFEKSAPGLYYNTAIGLDPEGKLIGKYRKMHIPDDPLFYEKFYFTPGNLGFQSWKTPFAHIGVCVCWDQWFPEAARLTALRGAEILFYPTAIGWHPGEKAEFGVRQHHAWETIQRSHAIANGCYVAAVNRVGHEVLPQVGGAGIEFWGQSFVCDPAGQILAKASADQEEVLLVPVDLQKIEEQRTHWPFYRDRRIEAYGEIQQRFIE